MTTPQDDDLAKIEKYKSGERFLLEKALEAQSEDNAAAARDNINAAMTVGKEVLKLSKEYDFLISPDQVSALYELRQDTILMAILEAAPDRAGDILTRVRQTDVKAFAELSARISKMRVLIQNEPFEVDEYTDDATDLNKLIEDLQRLETQIESE